MIGVLSFCYGNADYVFALPVWSEFVYALPVWSIFVFQADLEDSVIFNFLQLRADYRAAKISNYIK